MRLQLRHPLRCKMPGFAVSLRYMFQAILLLVPALAFSQKQISGTVKDSDGKPLESITVSLKGKNKSTLTDSTGAFKLSANPGDILMASSVNYEITEIKVDNRNNYNLVLVSRVKNLDEVIVIGYGTTTKGDLTGAVAKAPIQDMQKAPVRAFDEALAGRIAGVAVSSVDGQPGSDINIVIRGNNSVTQENSPLYVVDGFPLESPNTNMINTQDIESFEVLKDASATAIYGARGANGVIIITTKKGKTGPPVINFGASYGLQKVMKTMDLMTPYEFVKYELERNPSDAAGDYLTNGKTLESYKSIPEIDWQSKVFRTAPMQNYSLSMRGGNDYTKYYVSGNVLDQQGIMINSGYKRYQGTMSLDQNISRKLKAGVYINYSYMKQNGLPPSIATSGTSSTAATLFSVWGYRNFAISGIPNLEDVLLDPDVDPLDSRINPVLNQEHSLRENFFTNTIANGYLEYTIAPDLKLKITAGVTNNLTQRNQFNDTFTMTGNSRTRLGAVRGVNGSVTYVRSATWMNENTLSYYKKINNVHHITLVAGFSQTANKSSTDGHAANKLPRPALGIAGLNEGIPERIEAASSSWGLASFLGRLDYKYKSRYMFTFTFRTDGSSKFSPENRWAYFPSGAFAWRLSQEKFMNSLKNIVSDAKIRTSYGLTGNNRISDFPYLSAIAVSPNPDAYTFGNGITHGAFNTNFGNKDLKWETTAQFDIGLDLAFLKNRLSFTADVYRKKTNDLLLYANLPYTLGYARALRNIGSVQNQGLELTLGGSPVQNKDFSWESSINISFNKSKVLALSENESAMTSPAPFDGNFATIPAYITQVGNQLGMMYGYIWDGVYQYNDFDKTTTGNYILKDGVATNGNLRTAIQPGDIKFRDINGDLTVDSKDYAIIGRGLPIHTGGFNNDFRYRSFDLNIFFQWSYGNDIINGNRYIFEGNMLGRSNLNQFASYNNRWSPENTVATTPRVNGGGPTTPTGGNSRVVEDGSFLRLKTVSLGYTIPTKTLDKIHIKSCRVYVSAQNLITWTNYSGIDPEVSVFNNVLTPGFDYSAYPRPRLVTFGLNVNF
ncbi:SusC/RagA family TonB-linked outer membrane protein [Filimonas effusa]|uniref:TonB-dependent receptor n=1 Tax=Filimonas effusa TaxID=2508721 RepID=A0A4Q1D656_9BACT|nr:TonB-dependent receptor [Filimonas effusa]RXK83898.1 TonB-dependent receptor [Filimonas effusa]